MPRTDIPIVTATPEGTPGPSVNGDTVNGHVLSLDEGVILHVYNLDTVIHYLTIYIPVLVEGQTVNNLVVPINSMENLWLSGWEGTSFPFGFLTFDVDSNMLRLNAVKP